LDGHARTTGRLIQTLEVGGVKYTLRAPPIGRLIADMEAYIVSLRKNPFVMAAEAVADLRRTLSAEQLTVVEERIWKAAEVASVRSGAASAEEMDAFTQSLRGIAYQLYTCLEQDHGKVIRSVDDALSLIEEFVEEHGQTGLQVLQAKIHAATGEADAKNSSGPSPKKAGKGKGKKSRKSAAGRRSTSSLPQSTDSVRSK